MKNVCYIVEVTTALESLFDALNDYGFDYFCDEDVISPGMVEIFVQCYPHEVATIENIFAPYV